MHKFKRTNIHQVAKLADVSAMTVTRTFNGSAPVAQKTRERILKIASELGYYPNIMAQSLRTGKTKNIALLWGLGGPHGPVRVVRNISIILRNKGYAGHIADSLYNVETIKQCLIDFSNRKVDGIIIQLNEYINKDKEIHELLEKISNVVLVSPIVLDTDFDILIVDPSRALREIVDHFVEIGRRKMAFLLPPDEVKGQAFLKQVKFHGLSSSADSLIYTKSCWTGNEKDIGDIFRNTVKRKYGRKMPFDALIVSCDEGAAALISYLEDCGYRVPADIAVSGFNNNDMASCFRPPLASVDRCSEEVAEIVTGMLFNRIEHPDLPQQRKVIEMKFINRESGGFKS
ncbi:MAG: LacI family DNA-binding transcriptional regulator [Victivallaceae bacterium]